MATKPKRVIPVIPIIPVIPFIPVVNAQQWLNKVFPFPEGKEKVKKLYISLNKEIDRINQPDYYFYNIKLEGELDLNGLSNLENLSIVGYYTSELQPITNLKINRCSKLQYLYIDCTNLSELNLNT